MRRHNITILGNYKIIIEAIGLYLRSHRQTPVTIRCVLLLLLNLLDCYGINDIGELSIIFIMKLVHQYIKNVKIRIKNDYSTHNASIVKTLSAKSSTGTAAKLYLTCNNSLIALILFKLGNYDSLLMNLPDKLF